MQITSYGLPYMAIDSALVRVLVVHSFDPVLPPYDTLIGNSISLLAREDSRLKIPIRIDSNTSPRRDCANCNTGTPVLSWIVFYGLETIMMTDCEFGTLSTTEIYPYRVKAKHRSLLWLCVCGLP